jgi:predicted peroxiredoxin
MPSIYIISQWGPEAAERCYGPFVTGTTAQAQDVDADIFLMMDAVMLVKKGSAKKVAERYRSARTPRSSEALVRKTFVTQESKLRAQLPWWMRPSNTTR